MFNIKKLFIIGVLLFTGLSSAHAGAASENASKASKHSVNAVAHSAAASAQVVASVVAVPLIAVGSIGEVSKAAGNDLMKTAQTPIGTPLPISDKTVTVGPAPNEAIKRGNDNE